MFPRSQYGGADLNFFPLSSEKKEISGRAVLRRARGTTATRHALTAILSDDRKASAPAAVGGSDGPSQHPSLCSGGCPRVPGPHGSINLR